MIRDGVIYGPQVGIKLDGSIDFARDTANLNGTFVPSPFGGSEFKCGLFFELFLN